MKKYRPKPGGVAARAMRQAQARKRTHAMAREKEMERGRQARRTAKKHGMAEAEVYAEQLVEEERRINGYYRKAKPRNKWFVWIENIFLTVIGLWYTYAILFIIIPSFID